MMQIREHALMSMKGRRRVFERSWVTLYESMRMRDFQQEIFVTVRATRQWCSITSFPHKIEAPRLRRTGTAFKPSPARLLVLV